jgi:HEPN domain-containing protein
MSDRAKDWLAQAVRDLDQARDSKAAGRHEWACFASHQAAENALKALHLHLGQEAWGMSSQCSCGSCRATPLSRAS